MKLKQRLKACVSRLIDGGVLSARAYPLRQMMVEALLEQLPAGIVISTGLLQLFSIYGGQRF